MESNIMLRQVFPHRGGAGFQPRWNFRFLMYCFVEVTDSPVGKEQVILALDQIEYTLRTGGGDAKNID